MASLSCLAAARHRAAAADGWDVRARGLQDAQPQLVLYLSEEGHSCIRKAAEVLGLGRDGVCEVPVDGDLRMDVAALAAAIAADRAAGRRPFCVAASAGTVNTGAIDPLDDLAALSQREGLWLHVDGAYGAIGAAAPDAAPPATPASRARTRSPWTRTSGSPCRSSAAAPWCATASSCATRAASCPPYLRTEEGKGFGGLPWYSEYGFQQTRGFRALKLWMTLQHMGGRCGSAGPAHVAWRGVWPPSTGRPISSARLPQGCRWSASATRRPAGPGTRRTSTRSTKPWSSGSRPTGESS